MRDTTRFVASCCRWPIDADAQQAVARAAADVQSWDDVQKAVGQHRVAALVNEAVRDQSCVPEAFRAWVQEQARGTALAAMVMTRACLEADAALKAAGVQPLHLKGPVLGQLAYGSVALKQSRDLDIYVAQSEVRAAIAALEGLGYLREGQGNRVTDRLVHAVLRNCKELKFTGPTGILIELHWRLSDTSGDLSGAETDPRMQIVKVAGASEMHTMAAEQLVPYLCQHGAAHYWARLKWLADLSAYLNALSEAERDRVIAHVNRGPGRDVLAQALALCDTFFGTTYAPQMSRRAQALYTATLTRIEVPRDTSLSLRGVGQLINDIGVSRHLHASPWAGLWALRGHLIGQEDVMAWPLPAALNGLYVLIRVPSLLVRRLRASTGPRA